MKCKLNIDCTMCMRSALFISILMIALLVPSTNQFNLDTKNYIRHEGEPDSMFGFSVALHSEDKRSWVIIGAPRADTSRIQPEVIQGGAVYRCDIFDDNRCHLIPFDQQGNQFNDRNEQIDTKSHQWFGATVTSAGIDGPVVACAPRYVFHTMQPRKVVRVEPVGTCYMAKKNFMEFTEYSPCRTMFWGYHKQGSCQAGMSAALSKKGDRLFIGAPGSWYWQGQEYSINTGETYPYKPPRYGQYGEGQTYAYSLNSLNDPERKVWQTRESTASEDDSYLGYSSVSGDFEGNGNQGVAVGMPRGGGLLGKVLIFTWNLTNTHNITGEQIGAYFGYSLCVVDVDGDKLDDLIVGAPMHTEPNNEGKNEMGRIYVVYQDKFNKFKSVDTRDGLNSRARFGLALASLGDVNKDGFGDFAVGAPYDGPQGRGAVYIYHGSKDGPLEKPSQIIFAEDVAGTSFLSTFGFSLSGGIDLDGNMYPDLVVGAYEANKAYVFKSRPVAVMEASTEFEVPSKLVSLDDKKCQTIRDRKQVTCTTIHSCLKYTGLNLPASIDVEVSWVLDSKKPRSPRLYYLNEEGANIRTTIMRLDRGKTECRTERVYIADNVRDKLTPLEVEMKYKMRESNAQQVQPRSRRSLEPIIDQNKGTVARDAINIQKNCGPDNVCIPDLRLNVETVNTYLLGSEAFLAFDVTVSNYGEDAFEAGFFMGIPEGISYRKVERIGETRDVPITCTNPSAETNFTLKCDIGNPLPSGKAARFKVILLPATKHGIAPKYDFYAVANSTNEEEGTDVDNFYKGTVGISVETNLSVKGASIDGEILYNTTDSVALVNATREEQIGPQVVHLYEIRNGGPSTIEEAEVYFLWPERTLDGDNLLYLLNQPETTRNIRCELTPSANTHNLELDRSLVAKSYLVTQGAIEKSSLHFDGGRYASTSFQSNAGVQTGTTQLSEDEKKRFDEEENRESSGDASYVHRQRAQDAAREQDGSYQYSDSWRSHNGPVATYSASQNRSTYQGSDGRQFANGYSNEHHRGASNSKIKQDSGANIQRAGMFGSNSGGVRRVEDFSAEGSVNHELAGSRSRGGQIQSTQGTTSSFSGSAASGQTTGRRRMMSQQDGEPARPGLITGASQYDKNDFQAGTLELNTLGRDNVDEEIRRHGNAAHLAAESERRQNGASSSFQQSQNSFKREGSGHGSSQSHHSSSSSSFHGGKQGVASAAGNFNSIANDGFDEESDRDNPDYYEDLAEDRQHNLQQHQYHQQHQQLVRPTQSFNGPNIDQRFKHYPRSRRDLPKLGDSDLDDELKNRFQCNRTQCTVIRCVTSQLEKDSSAWIALRMRIVTQTVNLLAPNVPLNLSTMVVSRVSRLPYIGKPHVQPLKSHEVKITAVPIPEPKPDIVPLWIIILSACAGVLILLLLIYLLYKCGFFKRNRPDHSQERQPLNRNNGYHGDERL